MFLYVVTTTVDGTRAALMSAAALGRDLNARIVALVPHVVPYTDPLDRPTDSIVATGNRFRRLAEALAMQADIRVCLCRPHSRSLMPLLPLDGVILVGGRRRRWWPTREQRLLAELTKSGRRAMFIEYAWNPFLRVMAVKGQDAQTQQAFKILCKHFLATTRDICTEIMHFPARVLVIQRHGAANRQRV